MKKSYLLLAVPALLLGACSSEEEGLVAPGNGVTFEVNLPADMSTRAFADGFSANRLQLAVFEASTDPVNKGKFLYDKEVSFEENKHATTVTLDLVKGKHYDVIFWASKASDASKGFTSPYTFDAANGTITIDYTGGVDANGAAVNPVAINDENRDAFFSVKRNVEVGNSATTETVYLYRPFAQINVGTDDLSIAAEAGFNTEKLTSSVKVSNIYSKLDLYTGQASGEVKDLTFVAGAKAEDPNTFPGNTTEKTYTYLSMNYILTGIEIDSSAKYDQGDYTNRAQSESVNVDLSFFDDSKEVNTLNISNVPVQRNYRTNIFGSLLTSKVAFEVTKDPIPFTEDHNYLYSEWDGKTLTAIDKTGDVVNVNASSDFAWLVKDLAENAGDYAGKTIKLNAEMNMSGFPIEVKTAAAAFTGTFDGNGNTIKGLNLVSPKEATTDLPPVAFIQKLQGTVKNVNLDNLKINNTAAANSYVSGFIGIAENATIENVNVLGGSINGSTYKPSWDSSDRIEGTGAVVGVLKDGSKVIGCENAATVSGTSYIGGVVGNAQFNNTMTDMQIKDCKNTGVVSGNYVVGGIVGISSATVSNCTNSGEASCTNYSVGGIAGEQRLNGGIENCKNTADIYGNGANPSQYGVGGIVGWIRYIILTNSTKNDIVRIIGNTNTGSVIAPKMTGVGGIVGMWYNNGELYDNVSNAPFIEGSNFVSGILGGHQAINQALEGIDNILYYYGNTYTTATENVKADTNKGDILYINSADKVKNEKKQ